MPGSELSLYLTLTTILEIGVALAPPHTRLDSLPKVAAAAATAAKSLQSCLTLCNPIDGSPPGSPIPGILVTNTKWGGEGLSPDLSNSKSVLFMLTMLSWKLPE